MFVVGVIRPMGEVDSVARCWDCNNPNIGPGVGVVFAPTSYGAKKMTSEEAHRIALKLQKSGYDSFYKAVGRGW